MVRRSDEVAATIVEEARLRPGSVICMPTHGPGRLAELAIGTVTQDVVDHAPGPVVLVGPHVAAIAAPQRLVAAVDDTSTSARAVSLVDRWARAFGLDVELVEVLDPHTGGRYELGDVLESATLQGYATGLRAHGVDPSWEVLHGRDRTAAIVGHVQGRSGFARRRRYARPPRGPAAGRGERRHADRAPQPGARRGRAVMDRRRVTTMRPGVTAAAFDRDDEVWGVVAPVLPPRHGFLVAAGLETALNIVELRSFRGDVWALAEGTPVFADEPLVALAGPPVETERIARAVAETLAVQTATATAAARVVLAAGGRPVIDATSRTHAQDAARQRSRAAIIGGASHTTNLWAAAHFGVPAVEAHAPADAFPNVRGAVITADDLDEVELARLVHSGAPVTACAFGARVPAIALEVERWQHEPDATRAGPGRVLPCPVELYRFPAGNGDAVEPRSDPPVVFARPLLEHVMAWGRRIGHRASVADARDRCRETVAVLPVEVRDLVRPDAVGVTWSERVWRLRTVDEPAPVAAAST